MIKLQKVGGLAALYQAAAYLVAIVFFLFIVDYPNVVDPVQKVTLLIDNHVSMSLMHLAIYVVFGLCLVVLALALYDRLKAGAPALMQVATALGLIWAGLLIASGMIFNVGLGSVVALSGQDPAQAVSVWLAVDAVSSGLSSADGEILGGLWTLLVSWAALRAGGLPRALTYLGLVVGLVGLLSAVPILNDLTGVFGILQLVWFVGLGIVLLRSRPSTETQKPDTVMPRPRTT